MRILFPFLILAVSGCGTFTTYSLAQRNPKVEPIYGGVRTDINCIFGVTKEPSGEDWILKPFSLIDLPLSLAADTLTLPYAIIWTINHPSSAAKDKNKADVAGQLSTTQSAQLPVAEPAQPAPPPSPTEKAK